MTKKLDYQNLFYEAIYALIEHHNGSLEETLDDLRIKDKELREQIAKDIEWWIATLFFQEAYRATSRSSASPLPKKLGNKKSLKIVKKIFDIKI